MQKAVVVMALSVVSGMVVSVPERMQLTPVMKSKDWSQTSLIPIELTVGIQEMEDKKVTAEQAIKDNMGKYGSIAFAVRRPG